jgi:hypothetical protein
LVEINPLPSQSAISAERLDTPYLRKIRFTWSWVGMRVLVVLLGDLLFRQAKQLALQHLLLRGAVGRLPRQNLLPTSDA